MAGDGAHLADLLGKLDREISSITESLTKMTIVGRQSNLNFKEHQET